MNKYFVVAGLSLCWLSLPINTKAQESPTNESRDPAEMFLRSAPEEAVQKLKNVATAAEGMEELNRYFGQNAIGKTVTIRTRAEAVEWTPEGRNSARVRAASLPLTAQGQRLQRLSWLYFSKEDTAPLTGTRSGSEIVVTGVVRRCEVVLIKGGMRCNFDLWHCQLESHAKPGPFTPKTPPAKPMTTAL